MLPKIILTLLLIAGLSACAGTPAKEASVNKEFAAVESESGNMVKRCRYVKTTNSRLGDRVCKYVKE